MSKIDNDILILKQQKQLVQDRLKGTDEKLETLNKILVKKFGNSKTASDPSYTQSIDHMLVRSYMIPKNPIKSLPKQKLTSLRILNANINKNPIITSLRQQQLIDEKVKELDRIKIKKSSSVMIDNLKPYKPAVPQSFLPNRYTRGELPCTIEHGANGHYLSWMCPLNNIDYEYYLPIFFDGLQCLEHPSKFLARQGIEDLLYASKGHPERILKCLKQLILPMRNALLLYNSDVTLAVVKVIQQLLRSNPMIGEHFLRHGRQVLVPLTPFMNMTRNIGDSIDYRQIKGDDIGEEVRQTLELLEKHGGPNALASIKFCIPTYSSFGGSLSHSLGLESALNHQVVLKNHEGSLRLYIASLLEQNIDWKIALHELEAIVHASYTNEVGRKSSLNQGKCFLRTISEAFGEKRQLLYDLAAIIHHTGDTSIPHESRIQCRGHFTVLFGFFCGVMKFSKIISIRLYFRLLIRDIINAASRLSLIGPLQGAKMQVDFAKELEIISQRNATKDVHEMTPHQCNPFLDMIQSRHDILYSRLFSS